MWRPLQRGVLSLSRSLHQKECFQWRSALAEAETIQNPLVESETIQCPTEWKSSVKDIRNDWSKFEIQGIYQSPFLDLLYRAATVHRLFHNPREVQKCTLLNIKTGGCPEDCHYCSQSSKYKNETKTKAERLMSIDDVYQAALEAKTEGSTRFCMGAAWRGPSQVGPNQFQRVLEMVKRVRGLGLEVCATLGMLTSEQAVQLKQAGLTAYNHNLDTSPEHYPKVTTTRKYEDRLDTLQKVRDAGISVCCGGILGLGEETKDRISLLHQLCTMPIHPESVPINRLVAIPGTPMENEQPVEASEMIRCIATARILMPKSKVRLAAGRLNLTLSDQALCFLAGANSIFSGEKLLTTANNAMDDDSVMFETLGLKSEPLLESV